MRIAFAVMSWLNFFYLSYLLVNKMKAVVLSITKALESQNYFGALFMALTIPDICATVEDPKEKNVNLRYKKWFRENLKGKYYPDTMLELLENNDPEFASGLGEFERKIFSEKSTKEIAFTDEMCWKLRNSVLHAGSTDSNKYSFHLSHGKSHQNMVNGVLQISVVRFCQDICTAFDLWCEKNKGNEDIQRRLREGMRIQNEVSPGIHLG